METNRWRGLVSMSADHAGINQELGKLESELLRVLARIDDPRRVREYLSMLCRQSEYWCLRNSVDMRGWLARTRRGN